MLLIGGFFVASRFEPDPSGFGTHRQWGLPPCSVREAFDVPCPSCGMTTSFAHFVRGQFAQSASANPAGFLLALASAAGIPWSFYAAFQGRYWLVVPVSEVLLWVVGAVTVVALAQWLVRLFL